MAKEIGLSAESLKVITVAGAAANAAMTATGVKLATSELIAAMTVSAGDGSDANTLVNDLANVTISADDEIKSTTNNTARAMILIFLNHDKLV